MSRQSVLLLFLAIALTAAPIAHAAQCADTNQTRIIQHFYQDYRPGAPPPVPARYLRMDEFTVVSALPADQAYGVRSRPVFFRKFWESVDSWDDDAEVGVVVTVDGIHAWNFPSKVPQIWPSSDEWMIDLYADNGNGVHSHLIGSQVDSIWSMKLPTKEPGKFTRILALYNQEGQLIMGLYVSEGTKDFDPRALAGFKRTSKLLRTMPRICTPPS